MLHQIYRFRRQPRLNFISSTRVMMNSTKRKALTEIPATGAKRAKLNKTEVPEYHLTPSIKNEDGTIQWPAPQRQIDRAREIILEW